MIGGGEQRGVQGVWKSQSQGVHRDREDCSLSCTFDSHLPLSVCSFSLVTTYVFFLYQTNFRAQTLMNSPVPLMGCGLAPASQVAIQPRRIR